MTAPAIGVAVVGFGWMGQVHARAYARLPHHVPDAPRATLVAVVDPDAGRRADAAARFGPPVVTESLAEVLADPRVHAVSVTTPNDTHRAVGTAVADAGRHLWIEKPVGLTRADAAAVAAAVDAAGVVGTVGFNYRAAPAVEHARSLVADGAIGRVTRADVHLLTDYAAHPEGTRTWRFGREQGGNGVLGDLASHGVDLLRHLTGAEVREVVADTSVVIGQRPSPSGVVSHFATGGGAPLPVENPDTVEALLRLDGGVRATLRASRVSVGDQCTYGITVRGTRGSVTWDFRRMGELVVSSGDGYLDQPAGTVFVGPGAGAFGWFHPGAGNPMSYDDTKVVEAARFLTAVAGGPVTAATPADAVAAAAVLEAVERSVTAATWVPVT